MSFARSRSALQHMDQHIALVIHGRGEQFPAFNGMVELRGMMTFIKLPKVSSPSESGVTSSSSTFWKPPLKISAWIAAPKATASSGFCDVFNCAVRLAGDIPGRDANRRASLLQNPRKSKSSLTNFRTNGIRVCPPTRMIWSRSLASILASRQRAQAMPSRAQDEVAREVLQFGARQPLA